MIPGTIRGTRQMLRGEQWWPIWSPGTVTFGNAIVPTGTVFPAILELRNPARAFIAENCREPDLDEAVGDSIESSSS